MKKAIATILSLIIIAVSIVPMFALVVCAKPAEKYSFISKYYQVGYSTRNGLNENSVYDIAATPDGVLWFATGAGLASYNGFEHEIINKENTPDFGAVTVKKLFVDSKGRLWVATNDAGLFCKTGNTFKAFDIAAGALSNSVNDIAERSDGSIVVATAQGVYSIDNENNITVFENELGIAVQANVLAVDKSNDKIICITTTGVALLIDGTTIKQNLHYEAVTNATVTCAYYVEPGHFRCADDKGEIIEIFGDENNYTFSIINTGVGNISKMYMDPDGNWWVNSNTAVGYLDNDMAFHIVQNLKIDNVTSIFVDFQGNYWFSSSNAGLLELCPSIFSNINDIYSVGDSTPNCVITYRGNFYIGTENGLIAISETTGEEVTNKLINELAGRQITDMCVDSDENLFVATAESGVFIYKKNGAVSKLDKDSGLTSNEVNDVDVLGNKFLFIGTDNGVTVVQDSQSIWSMNESNGLTGNIRCMHLVPGTREWLIGTESNGIYVLNEDHLLKENNGFTDTAGSVNCFTDSLDEQGIWVGVGAKLYYLSNDKSFKEISKLNLLHSIVDIMHTPDNKLWIITSDEIIVADESNLLDDNEKINVNILDKSDGLESSINKNAKNYMDSNGNLYLCCDGGVMKVNTVGCSAVSLDNPKFSVSGISTEAGPLENTAQIEIPDTAQRLEIDLSVVSYMPNENYTIKYKLEGQDKVYSTIQASGNNQIVYTNLPGGNYTFYAYLSNDEDDKECCSLSFDVKKDFTYSEQWLFKMAMFIFAVILFILITYLILFLKNRSNKKKQELYKEITREAMVSFAKAIDAKDQYTKGHSERVAKYAVEIAKRYGLAQDRLDDIYYTALLHDIGKIGIPDSILKKPDKLTDEEFEIIKTHTTLGAEILSDMKKIKNIQFGARDHHEKYNGTGYPRGLEGNRISFEGRLIGAADAYDAMATSRGYNEAFDIEHIKAEITEQSGQQFDPKMAEILVEMIDDGYFEVLDDSDDSIGEDNE